MTRVNPNRLVTRNDQLLQGLAPGPQLKKLEAVIERGIQSFIDVGNALLEIRESRLYRERGFASFDEYTREQWGFKRSYAHDLMASAKVVAEIETSAMADTSRPTNERQVRELRRAEDPVEVWAEVVEEHEPAEITAAVIREHVEARQPEASEPVAPLADLAAVTSAVRAAVRAGATTNELYAAYQAGFH